MEEEIVLLLAVCVISFLVSRSDSDPTEANFTPKLVKTIQGNH